MSNLPQSRIEILSPWKSNIYVNGQLVLELETDSGDGPDTDDIPVMATAVGIYDLYFLKFPIIDRTPDNFGARVEAWITENEDILQSGEFEEMMREEGEDDDEGLSA